MCRVQVEFQASRFHAHADMACNSSDLTASGSDWSTHQAMERRMLSRVLSHIGGSPKSLTVSSQGKDRVGSLAKRFILMVSRAPAPGVSRSGKLAASTFRVILPS